MESNIVHDFQNLRVFSNRSINRMDELVKDLSNALEETSKGTSRAPGGCQENALSVGAVARRHHKRRRGARRSAGNLYWQRGTISEASESSIDEAIRDYIDSSVVAAHSDSDDLSLAYSKQRLMVSVSEPVPPVESDSFTENLSPLRPQRRRRRYKHMAVDSLQPLPPPREENCIKLSCPPIIAPSTSFVSEPRPVTLNLAPSTSTRPLAAPSPSSTPSRALLQAGASSATPTGKRKRSSKSRSEGASRDAHREHQDSMDITSISQESSSLSSSEFDSDVYQNGEEGREADDEQSDFFHEPEPGSEGGEGEGAPWWEKEGGLDSSMAASQEEFDSLLSGALAHMSMASQRNFRQRVDKMLARAESGREIRIGRRKLKEKFPRYTMLRFLQDREHWNSIGGGAMAPHFSPGVSQSGDYKRLRQTPPPPLDPSEEGFVGVGAMPIPDSNIGNQMLQSMGWTPGRGLGAEGDGRQDPVVAYRRRGRKGLGYDTQSDT